MEKTTFSTRGFISLAILAAGLLLPVSGIMNHHLQFEPLTMERHYWMSVHNSAAFLFTLLMVIHLIFNWKALIHHIHKSKEIFIRKEAVLSILLVITWVGIYSSHALLAGTH